MNINNNSIVTSSTFTRTAALQQATQAEQEIQTEQHNDPLFNIVLTEAGRSINFIAGMIGSFFNAHQGPVNLSEVEPITEHPSSAQAQQEDHDFYHIPQTPNPEMFYLEPERPTSISYLQTPNPEMFYLEPERPTSISYPQTPNPEMFNK